MCSGTWACGHRFFTRIWQAVIFQTGTDLTRDASKTESFGLKETELGPVSMPRREVAGIH